MRELSHECSTPTLAGIPDGSCGFGHLYDLGECSNSDSGASSFTINKQLLTQCFVALSLGWLWFDGDRHYLLSWGKQSGAHINPVVTFTFWRLGKVKSWDAFFYIMAVLED